MQHALAQAVHAARVLFAQIQAVREGEGATTIASCLIKTSDAQLESLQEKLKKLGLFFFLLLSVGFALRVCVVVLEKFSFFGPTDGFFKMNFF